MRAYIISFFFLFLVLQLCNMLYKGGHTFFFFWRGGYWVFFWWNVPGASGYWEGESVWCIREDEVDELDLGWVWSNGNFILGGFYYYIIIKSSRSLFFYIMLHLAINLNFSFFPLFLLWGRSRDANSDIYTCMYTYIASTFFLALYMCIVNIPILFE